MGTWIKAPDVDGVCCQCQPLVCDDCSCPIPEITSALVASATSGVPFTYTITATHFPTSYGASGLPLGLSVNTSTGLISGTTTALGPHSITISAHNYCGTGTAVLVLTVRVPCPSGTMMCDSITATKSKCGFDEYIASSPPRVYLEKFNSGSMVVDTSPGTITNTWSGHATYDRLTCSLINDGGILTVNDDSGSVDPSCLNPQTTGPIYLDGAAGSCSSYLGRLFYFINSVFCVVATNGTCADSSILSVLSNKLIFNWGLEPSGSFSGVTESTLTSEYTTTELINDVINLLPSYPDTWAGSCSSQYQLDSDQRTFLVRRFRYKFTIPAGSLVGATGYTIAWLQGSTPMSYVWNCLDTETPIYEVLEPLSNGTIGISGVTYTCNFDPIVPTITNSSYQIITSEAVLGAYNSGFLYQIHVTNCTTATSYSLSGSLPSGLSFNTSNGRINGTPSGSGAPTATVVVIRAINAVGASAPVSLTINLNGYGGTGTSDLVAFYIDPAVVFNLPKINACTGNIMYLNYRIPAFLWNARIKIGADGAPGAFWDTGCVHGRSETPAFTICNNTGPAVCLYVNITANCTSGPLSGSYQWALTYGKPTSLDW